MLRRLAWTSLLVVALSAAQAQNAPQITALDHNVNGWVTRDTQVRFTLRGTAGGQAVVQLVGLPTQVAMRERARGQYEASWTPEDGISAPRVPVRATLTVNGRKDEMVAARPLAIDTVPPTVTELTPADRATVQTMRPEISARVADTGGSGVDALTLQVVIDQDELTPVASMAAGRTVVVPPADLAPGAHQITLEISDQAGNTTSARWSIVCGGTDRAPATDTGGIQVEGDSWIEAGDSIKVTANGPARAQATFSLVGVQDNIPMRQVGNGVYEGTWAAPADRAITVTGVPLLVRFKAGNTETTVQHPGTLSIDTVAPQVEGWHPMQGGQVNDPRPWIHAFLADGSGSGINAGSLQWLLDDQRLDPDEIDLANGRFVWRPKNALRVGAHFARLVVKDVAGNQTSHAWAFTVTNDGNPVRQIIHDGRGLLQPGDAVSFQVEAGPRGKVTVDVGDKVRFDLPEVAAGSYVGQWKVRPADRFADARVTVIFTDAAGKAWPSVAPQRVTTAAKPVQGAAQPTTPAAPAMTKPTIASPTEGATVDSPLTITGKAAAGAEVRLKLDYVTRILVLNVAGTLLEQVVKADADGNWRLDGVNLDTSGTGRGTRFTLTAWMVSAGDKLSDPTTVTFRR